MADDKSEKSLEMRVAELEDRLSQIHITEDEMKAYQKVSALLAGGGADAALPRETAIAAPGQGAISNCINECGGAIFKPIIRRPWVVRQPIVIQNCWAECQSCQFVDPGGPAAGGQFGQLGG